MSQDIPQSIALFDFSHAINVAYNAAGPDQAGDIVIQQLSAIRSSCGRVVVCLDSKPYKRSAVFDGYKAGRKQDPELAQIWERTLDRVSGEGYALARADGEEADDVIATLARIYSEDYACPDVRLVTADKDIAQCVNKHVRWFVPQLGKRDEFEIRDEQWVRTKWGGIEWEKEKKQKTGPEPKDVPLVLAIMGDTSDKIPGVKGIGIKGAVFLVSKFQTPAGMAEQLMAEQRVASSAGKELEAFWRNFAAGMAQIPKWLQLTTLNTDVALNVHPLKYLEHIEPRQLVAEEPSDADDSAFMDEAFPGEPTAEELKAERLAMAAPVDPVLVDPQWGHRTADGKGFLVAEPMPDGPERRAQQARESDKHMPMPAMHDPSKMVIGKDPKADEALRELAAKLPPFALAGKPGSHSSTPSNGSGPAALAQTTSQSTDAAPSGAGAASLPPPVTPPEPAPSGSSPASAPSQVVPKTQGPRKGDEIPQQEGIVRVAPPSWALAAQPATAREMLAIASTLWNSRLYAQFGSERGVFAVMALGRELGMGMAESLEAFFIVQDRPFPKAVWILSRGQRHPDCVWLMVTAADEKHAVLSTMHRQAGRLDYEYTIERAAKAGYLTGKNKHNWETKTQEMLEARAISKGVRRWYPGATFGMHSFEEEQDRG